MELQLSATVSAILPIDYAFHRDLPENPDVLGAATSADETRAAG